MTDVRMFSHMRGGAKKYVGPMSCKSVSTVSLLSGQLRVNPPQ